MRCASSRGFTLLEVLAALLLVAIVLPVVMGVLDTSTHVGGLAHDRAEATLLAENKLNQVLLDQSWQFGDAAGTFEDDLNAPSSARYHWTLHVETWQDPTVRLLSLTVQWERRGREQALTLTTAVHDGGNA